LPTKQSRFFPAFLDGIASSPQNGSSQ